VKQLLPYKEWITAAVVLMLTTLGSYLIASGGVVSGLGLMAIPFVSLYLVLIWINPKLGVYTIFIFSFFAIGLTRYVPGPLGMGVDGLLVLTVFVAFVKNFRYFTQAFRNIGVWLAILWFVFTFLELFNPIAHSRAAWFYAVRGVSIYPVLFLIGGIATRLNLKDFYRLMNIGIAISVLASFWGMKQLYIGLDYAEKRWLDAGGAITHLLRGKLRVFSFYSDAGQFGAGMGYTALVCGILAFHDKVKYKKVLYLAAAGITFFGLAISGTRGALFVPIAGVMVYLFLSKNVRVFTLGLFVAFMGFAFLKFTSIGNSNYNIARMRSALNPNDASLQVRLDNQKKLAKFLADKPFGGGIGAGGSWGARFSPGSFLAETALDSWYVKIWAEMGVIGLSLHLLHLFIILGFGSYIAFYKMGNAPPQDRFFLIALMSGYFGVMVANYGNQIYGQMPLSFTLQLTILVVFFFWEKIKINGFAES